MGSWLSLPFYDSNSATAKIKEGFRSVKVAKDDATQVQQEMNEETFNKWHERCEVMETKNVQVENIQSFLDHLKDAYEGINEEMRRKMNGILWSEEWAYKIMEFKYNAAGGSGARYGMIAFGKSKDGKFVDCMYCMYMLDFEVAVKRSETSILWGLIKWHSEKKGLNWSEKRIRNFFRFKALEGFYHEGLIDNINVVHSIEDVPSLDH